MNAAEISSANDELSGATPDAVARWAEERLGESAVATVSLQTPVLPHLLTVHAPSVPLVFLDTQYHFKATLAYRHELEDTLGRRILVVEPEVAKDDLWRRSFDACCNARKVLPLRRMLSGRNGLITGVRSSDNLGRRSARHVEYDVMNEVVRVNPLLEMSDDDVKNYIVTNELPTHPLSSQGYASIGCWPCTTPVKDYEDPRAGRWRDDEKTECGLHYVYEQHSNL
jgi:phosphoadenosine phosphosulfate reductase